MSDQTPTSVKLMRAFQPGDVVFIETDKTYSADQTKNVQKFFHNVLGETGVKIIILQPGMRIAAREEVPA